MTCNDGVRDAQPKKDGDGSHVGPAFFWGEMIWEKCQSTLTHSYFFGCAIHIPYILLGYEIFSNISLLSLSKSTAIWPFPQPPTACQTYNADSTACTRACLVGEFDTVVVNGNSGDTLVERIGRGSKITRQQQRIKRYVLWVIHYSRCSGCFLLVNFKLDLWTTMFFSPPCESSIFCGFYHILSILNHCSFQKPIWSMYGIFPYIWSIFIVNVGI